MPQGGAGGAFIIPRPGVNGAKAGALAAKTIVLTGIFPELGGGAGLELGKGRCRAMIEAFGGRVTGSVSGKTDYLVVGKEPGASKVSQAAAKGVPTVDIAGLKAVLEVPGASLEAAPAAHIGAFSAGYHGNALRLEGGAPKAPAIKAPKAAKKPKAEAPEGEPAAKKAKKAPAAKKKKKSKAEEEEEEEEDDEGDYEPKAKKKAAAKPRAKRAQ